MSDQEKQVMIVKVKPVLKKDGTQVMLHDFGLPYGWFKVVAVEGDPFVVYPWKKDKKNYIRKGNFFTGGSLDLMSEQSITVQIMEKETC